MKGGLVLVVAGVWVLCQVLGGQALQRLNVIAGGTPASASSGSSSGSGSGPGYDGPSGGRIGSGAV